MNTLTELYQKALNFDFLSIDEGLFLYENAPTTELMYIGNELRKKHKPGNIVTWIIDRNINITNVCISGCQFCNFYRGKNHCDAYITTIDEYKIKIDELYRLGGNQILLQGGLHPELGLAYYEQLFKELKEIYPDLKLHALGPPEIFHISKMENRSYRDVLERLMVAGLDSLPGAGAEILSDRTRSLISKNKCTTNEWLDVMRVAHQLGLVTSATMMFGHLETKRERLEHLSHIRQVQSEKPIDTPGFIAFISWPFIRKGTNLEHKVKETPPSAEDYIRFLAISRIMLPNIENIQASWLTVGAEVGQICLHAGGNDMGSIMIEENVVSSAGANFSLNAMQMQETIKKAGYIPQLRDQKYNCL